MSDQSKVGLLRVGTALIVGAVVVYFFLLGRNVPLFADDYCRWYEGIDLVVVLSLVRDEYFGWTGRFPVMFLTYLFFSAGNAGVLVLDIINAVAMGVVCYLVVSICGCKSFSGRVALVVFFLFLFWFMPEVFGEVVLWKTGAIQYFWGVVVATACLTPVIRFAIWGDSIRFSGVTLFLYAALAFLGGAWLESLSPAVALVWSAALLFARFSRRASPSPALIIALACWIVGTIVLIAAPGNYERVGLVASDRSLWDGILHIGNIIPGIPSRSLLFLIIGFMMVSVLSGEEDLKQRVLVSSLFLAVAVLSAFSLAAVPIPLLQGRTAFATEYFMILAAISVFPCGVFCAQGTKLLWLFRGGLLVACAGCLILLVTDMKSTYNTYRWVMEQNSHRESLVQAALQRGELSVELPPLHYGTHWNTAKGPVNRGRFFGRDIHRDPHYWTNGCYQRAHGLKQVRLPDQ